jgi:peroxiredoxin
MREELSVVLKVLLRDPASYPPESFPPALVSSVVIRADEYLTSSSRRVNGSGLEWCGRELGQEVLVAAEVGEKDPGFNLPVDDSANTVSLEEYTKRGPVALFFYRGGWSSACPDRTEEPRPERGRFEEKDASVLAISADSPWFYRAFAADQGIECPLLADFDREVIEDYAVRLEAASPIPPTLSSTTEGSSEPSGSSPRPRTSRRSRRSSQTWTGPSRI